LQSLVASDRWSLVDAFWYIPTSRKPSPSAMKHPDSFGARATLEVGPDRYTIFRLDALRERSAGNADRLPFSLKILLENLLRGGMEHS
jgi:hypothetical protein